MNMPDTVNKIRHRMTIRVGHSTLSFAKPNDEGNVLFEPYVVKSGISIAANLREAFKTSEFLKDLSGRARVLVDSDTLLVPMSHFDEMKAGDLFFHSFPQYSQNHVFFNVMQEVSTVVLSSINKDLKLVLDDHFEDVRLVPAMTPVWGHLYQRSFTGGNQKLFAYVHEHKIDIFCFQQNRFKFCNSYDAKHVRDAVYYLLYVWNLLQFDAQNDELHLVGDIFQSDSASMQEDRETLLGELRRFLQKVYVVNPSADFNRAQVTSIKNMPYDMQTIFVKGK